MKNWIWTFLPLLFLFTNTSFGQWKITASCTASCHRNENGEEWSDWEDGAYTITIDEIDSTVKVEHFLEQMHSIANYRLEEIRRNDYETVEGNPITKWEEDESAFLQWKCVDESGVEFYVEVKRSSEDTIVYVVFDADQTAYKLGQWRWQQ